MNLKPLDKPLNYFEHLVHLPPKDWGKDLESFSSLSNYTTSQTTDEEWRYGFYFRASEQEQIRRFRRFNEK